MGGTMTQPASTVLVVDGGRSGLRLATLRDGLLQRFGTEPGLTPIAVPGAPDAAARAIIEAAGDAADASFIVAGLTGAFESTAAARQTAELLRRQRGTQTVVVTSDVVTSHLGALEGSPGIVAAVGTGSVTFGLDHHGRWNKVDGWGFLIGDQGSGFDIGRRGLQAALATYDGRRADHDLLAAAQFHLGTSDSMAEHLYAAEEPVPLIAAFTTALADLARNGHPTANEIFREAAQATATAIGAGTRGLALTGEERRWSWAGSVLGIEDLVRSQVERQVADEHGLALTPPRGDALDGAALLVDRRLRQRLRSVVQVAGAGDESPFEAKLG